MRNVTFIFQQQMQGLHVAVRQITAFQRYICYLASLIISRVTWGNATAKTRIKSNFRDLYMEYDLT